MDLKEQENENLSFILTQKQIKKHNQYKIPLKSPSRKCYY